MAPDALGQQRLTVKLKDGREFKVRPDYLDSLTVSQQGKLQVAYPEAKASRVVRPTEQRLDPGRISWGAGSAVVGSQPAQRHEVSG